MTTQVPQSRQWNTMDESLWGKQIKRIQDDQKRVNQITRADREQSRHLFERQVRTLTQNK